MKGRFYDKKITIGGRTFEQGKVYDNPFASSFTNLNNSTMLFEVRDVVNLSEGLEYHIRNEIPLHENIYRAGSLEYLKLFRECRELVESKKLAIFDTYDQWFVDSDLGEVGKYNGRNVLLDFPQPINESSLELQHLKLMRKAMKHMPGSPNQKKIIKQLNKIRKELDLKPLTEAEYDGEEVELNEPKRGGSKKYYVYVKNPDSGQVNKVEFGAEDGGQNLSVKFKDKEARKNFASRHNCSDKKDKTKPGYWSCNLPKYADQLGLSGGGQFYW